MDPPCSPDGRVAGPGLKGGQVAILRLQRGGLLPRNGRSILFSYRKVCALWHQNTTEHQESARTTENSVKANFGEHLFYEVRMAPAGVSSTSCRGYRDGAMRTSENSVKRKSNLG